MKCKVLQHKPRGLLQRGIMLKLNDSLTLRKYEEQSFATQAKRLAAARDVYTAAQGIMLKLKDSLTLRKYEVQSVATQAKRLAAARVYLRWMFLNFVGMNIQLQCYEVERSSNN